MTVSGAATPAVETISAKPKKKLMAGAMLASVAAEISKLVRTPRARRAGSGRWAVPLGAVVPAVATVVETRYSARHQPWITRRPQANESPSQLPSSGSTYTPWPEDWITQLSPR